MDRREGLPVWRVPAQTGAPNIRLGARAALYPLAAASLALALVVLLFYFVTYLVYARSLFAFPFDYDQGEGFELYDAIRLARGEHIYLDNARYPFYSSNYPPVYRLLLAPLVALFGPHLWVGRALTFATSLILGGLIALAARRAWAAEARAPVLLGAALLPAYAGLAFFAANYVYHVGPLARAHVPMVMFAFAGLLCLDVACGARRSARWAGLGVALLVVAGFTKLQAVDALAAGFAYLLLRQPRWGLRALLVSALVTAAVVLALNVATQGQFWLNVVLANVNEYDIAVTWQTYGQWFRLQAVLIICSALYVGWDAARALRARSLRPITIWSLYFVAGSAMGMLTGKWGAGPTYLIAAIAASCVCTVGLLGRLWRALVGEAGRPAWRPAVALLAGAIFLAQGALNVRLPTSGRLFGAVARLIGVADAPSSYPPYPYYDAAGFTQLGHLLDPADAAAGWAIVEVVRSVQGPVWSEEAMFTLLAGKDVVTNPTQLLNLSKAGLLDTSQMIAMIEQRAFGAVIFRALFYPDDVKAAIFRNYYWAHRFTMNGFDYWVLLRAEG
jgi:hypothetical protein